MKFSAVLLLALYASGCSAEPGLGLTGAPGPEGGARADLGGLSQADLAGPRGPFPIVLAHGFSGFRHIGPLTYFYGVADALRKDGHVVYVAAVLPYQTSYVRGKQLADYIDQVVLPETGKGRVVIIAHSQGGIDARYAASLLGDRIAAIVTVATPHAGTEVADIAVGDRKGPLQAAVSAFFDLLGAPQGDSDAWAAMNALTTKGMADFNQKVPDQPGVVYYSVGGRSSKNSGDGLCNPSTEPGFIAGWDSYLDPLGVELWATGDIIEQNVVPRRPNDGLVSVESARWGTFLGCVPADHLGEICQIAGAPRGGGNPFTCVRFYRDLAGWLAERGL